MSKLITLTDHTGQVTHLDPRIVSIIRVMDRTTFASWDENGKELPYYILINIFRQQSRSVFDSQGVHYSVILNYKDKEEADRICQLIVDSRSEETQSDEVLSRAAEELVSKIDMSCVNSQLQNGVKEALLEKMRSLHDRFTFSDLIVNAIKEGAKEVLQTQGKITS